MERVCDAGAGSSILILTTIKIGSPTRSQRAGVQAPGGNAREKPEGARRTPTPFTNEGQ